MIVGLVASSCRTTPSGSEAVPSESEKAGVTVRKKPKRTVSFEDEIKPLLGDHCVNCHNRELMPERTSFEWRELAMEATDGTPLIVPYHPEKSRLIAAVVLPDVAERAMPPVGHRISAEQVELLRRWIAEGAHWPQGPEGRIKPMEIPME